MPIRLTAIPVLLLLIIGTLTQTTLADEKVDFSHDIVPILRQHCAECHTGDKAEGGFSMNSRNHLLDAEAIVAGNAAESRLVQLVISSDVDDQMPPKDKPRVSAENVEQLRRWIDEGADWEAGFRFDGNDYVPPLQPRRPDVPTATARLANPVDRIINVYLSEQGISWPDGISDAAFARRAWLDLAGLLPPTAELDEFLADDSPTKRESLVDRLLADDTLYAQHWLTFWNDLLRNDYKGTGYIDGGRKQISAWLYRSLRENKPYDQFVRELLSPTEESAGFINGIQWRGNVNSSQRREIQFAQNITQVFLGINMKCASCHDSFIDRWTLAESYNLAAVYATEPLEINRCDKPTGVMASPKWIFPELGTLTADAEQPQRLQELSQLMTHPENGRFTRTIVNRLWERTMGRGIVHPTDAMHTPPWNEDLLDFLAVDLADHGYDLKHTLRLITTSRIYQASSAAAGSQAETAGDRYTFRGPIPRRMTAEQFLDAVWRITDTGPRDADPALASIVRETDHIPTIEIKGRGIWSSADTSSAAAGETRTFRRRFELSEPVERTIAFATCDNGFRLFINGAQVAKGDDWSKVEATDVTRHLRPGENEILVIAINAGQSPNPASLYVELQSFPSPANRDATATSLLPRIGGEGARRADDGAGAAQPIVVAATDATWEFTELVPDDNGSFGDNRPDWQPAVVTVVPVFPFDSVIPTVRTAMSQAAHQRRPQPVRASLVASSLLMRTLGRPNREQVVTARPGDLTTMEAIDLSNGEELTEYLLAGGRRLVAAYSGSTKTLVHELVKSTLSRAPTTDETEVLQAVIGTAPTAESIADALWLIIMLPEFQHSG